MPHSLEKSVCSSLILFVIGSLCWCRAQNVSTPVILNVQDKLEVSTNSTLHLTCQGQASLRWDIYRSLAVTTQETSDLLISTALNDQSWITPSGVYYLNLTLTGVQYFDTGKYTCRYGFAEQEAFHDGFHTTVYVFVNDSSRLFLQHEVGTDEYRLYDSSPTQPLVLPCQTTSPRLEVQLWKEKPLQEITNSSSLGMNVSYDPSIGFNFTAPTKFMHGKFSCRTQRDSVADVLTFWIQDLGSGPPVILNAANDYLVVRDPVLTLTCLGEHELVWSFPDYVPRNERYRARQTDTWDEASGLYLSVLTFTGTVPALTGKYTCKYSFTSSHKFANVNSDTIHVFIPDPSNLLVPFESDPNQTHVLIKSNFLNILPLCIPTSPDVSVTLWKVDPKGDKNVSSLKGVKFDRTEGFVIDTRQERKIADQFRGEFYCKATLGLVTLQKNFVMDVETFDPKSLMANPVIDADEPISLVGQNITLVCSLVQSETPRTNLNWVYPNVQDSRVHVEEVKSLPHLYGRKYIRRLTVQNAQWSDRGVYTCQYRNVQGVYFKNDYYADMREPSKVSLELIVDNSGDTSRWNRQLVKKENNSFVFYGDEYSQVDLSVRVVTSGQTIRKQITWTKDGDLLQDSIQTAVHTKQEWTNLTVWQLDKQTFGVYNLTVRVAEAKESLSVTLSELELPIAVADSVKEWYLEGEMLQITCGTSGSPPPTPKWTIMSADSVLECGIISSDNATDDGKNSLATYGLSTSSVNSGLLLKGKASMSACLLCSASNFYDKDHQLVLLIVSEYDQLFMINTSLDSPYEGQEVNLTCSVSSFVYGEPDWYRKVGQNLLPVRNKTGVKRVPWKTNLSKVSRITFESVSSSDSGSYLCLAKRFYLHLQSQNENMTLTLQVRELSGPTFLEATDSDSERIVATDGHARLDCMADGGPDTNVTWQSSEQKPLDLDESQYRISDSPFVLDLQNVTRNMTVICDVSNPRGSIQKKFYVYVENNNSLSATDIFNSNMKGNKPQQDLKTSSSGLNPNTVFIVLAVALFILLAIGGGILFIKFRRQKTKSALAKNSVQFCNSLEFQHSRPSLSEETNIPFDLEWEFPKQRLIMGPKIGHGAFGKVIRAEACGIKKDEDVTTVAVKMLKANADTMQKRALLAELKILILLGKHVNIVNLLGADTKHLNKGELLVIVEYCSLGSLRDFLIRHQKRFVNQLDPVTDRIDKYITTPQTDESFDTNQTTANSNSTGRLCLDSGISGASSAQTGDSGCNSATCLTTSGTRSASNYTSVSTGRPCIDSGTSGSSTVHTGDSGFTSSNFQTTSGTRRTSSVCKGVVEEDENSLITTTELLNFAFQCSRGMEYLTSRKLVHRDLAARNVLLTTDRIIKICDFGLTKDLDYLYQRRGQRKNTPLPIRWMAPESIGQNVFSTKSDVWSFGVLLWETFSLGIVPYPGVDINDKFYKRVLDGYRLDKPTFAPNSVYTLMQSCWSHEPSSRPDFDELTENIGFMIEEEVRQYYMDLNADFEAQNNQDPNYKKMGEILATSVSNGDNLKDLVIPEHVSIEEDEELEESVRTSTTEDRNATTSETTGSLNLCFQIHPETECNSSSNSTDT